MTSVKNPLLKNIDSGELIEIVKSPFTIGRGLGSDYVIKSKVVSRTHCSLEKTENGWVLDDLSTNGTMVNDDLYKATRSPVLKCNDEICLGFHTYTYKFLIDTKKIPNLQVEKLKAEEVYAVSKNMPSPSPDSPNSFDENGISDEVLNGLADDILHNVEETDGANESNEVCLQQKSSQIIPPTTVSALESKDVQDIPATVTFNKVEQTIYPCDKIVDPIKIMLQESPPAVINQAESHEHSNSYSDIFNILIGTTNLSKDCKEQMKMTNEMIGQENNIVYIPETNLQEEGSDSLTINNGPPSLQGTILPAVVGEDTNAMENENSNSTITCSMSKEQPLELPLVQKNNVSTTVPASFVSAEEIMDPVERFKIHFDAILDDVVKGTSDSLTVNVSHPTLNGTLSVLPSVVEKNANFKESEYSNNIATYSSSKEQIPSVQENINFNNSALTSTKPAVIAKKNMDSVERFKINFDATLDDVMKKYCGDLHSDIAEDSTVTTTTSASILTTSGEASTLTSTYASTIQPTHSYVRKNQYGPAVAWIRVPSTSSSSGAAFSAKSIMDPVEKFKINFDATLDDVVKKYCGDLHSDTAEDSAVTTTTSASILTTSGEASTLTNTYSSTIQPTHSYVRQNQYGPAVAWIRVPSTSSSSGAAFSAKSIMDPVEKFKINFDATLDDVMKKYCGDLHSDTAEDSTVTTTTSASILTTSGEASTLTSTNASSIQPTSSFVQTNQNLPSVSSISVTSSTNSFKKMKVMAAAPLTSLSSVHMPKMTSGISGMKLSNSPNSHRVIILKPSHIYGANSSVQNTIRNPEQSFQHINTTLNDNLNTTATLRSARMSMLVNVPASHENSNPTSSASNFIDNQADIINSLSVVNHETVSTVDTHESNKAKVQLAAKRNNSQEPTTSTAAEKLPSKKEQNQNQFEEMENELMCAICANLFIKAVTLGCSHSFCSYCIEQWKKKKSDCPICRNKITSSIRTLVLDNLIEKMLENSSVEDRKQREDAVQERDKIEEAEKVGTKKQNNNRHNRQAVRRDSPIPPPIINLVDSPSTTDSEESDIDYDDYDYDDYYTDEWYNGRPGAYFGGYGRCYRCGDRGHWANGCPNR